MRPTRFLGCVGDDPAGDRLVDELGSRGVDVRVQRRGETGTIVVLVDQRGERTMFPSRGASALLEPPEAGWTAGLTHLHAPAYSFEVDPARSTVVGLLEAVRAAGGSVSVDASSCGLIARLGVEEVRRLLRDLAPDWLFANEEEAAMLATHGEDGWLPDSTTLVVKHGPSPTVVRRGGRVVETVPVAPVEDVRDTTGCGDAFAAAFLDAVLDGAPLRAACLAGHELAATLLGTPGASG
jgi:sugar/nucleoside kinase (ribokinase family)